jgi:hypothetical protein
MDKKTEEGLAKLLQAQGMVASIFNKPLSKRLMKIVTSQKIKRIVYSVRDNKGIVRFSKDIIKVSGLGDLFGIAKNITTMMNYDNIELLVRIDKKAMTMSVDINVKGDSGKRIRDALNKAVAKGLRGKYKGITSSYEFIREKQGEVELEDKKFPLKEVK